MGGLYGYRGGLCGLVTGVMNTAGQLGGFVCSVLFGYVVKATGRYEIPVWGVAAMVMIAAVLFSRIDPTRQLYGKCLATEAVVR